MEAKTITITTEFDSVHSPEFWEMLVDQLYMICTTTGAETVISLEDAVINYEDVNERGDEDG